MIPWEKKENDANLQGHAIATWSKGLPRKQPKREEHCHGWVVQWDWPERADGRKQTTQSVARSPP